MEMVTGGMIGMVGFCVGALFTWWLTRKDVARLQTIIEQMSKWIDRIDKKSEKVLEAFNQRRQQGTKADE